MRLIYVFISAIFLLLAIFSYYNYKRKRIRFVHFVTWTGAFLALSVLSLFPDLVNLVMGLLGLIERVNFLVVMLIIITPSFIFIQLNSNNRLKREISQLTQTVGIQRFFNEKMREAPGKSIRKNNILVKMAAYNEEQNIGAVLEKMPSDVDVLVVDDCSSDQTGKIAAKHGAMVVRHDKNLGQGIGDITGFILAFELGYEYIIEMDADGQHDPTEIPLFIKTLKENSQLDIAVGSRVKGSQQGKTRSLRKIFLPLYTNIINWASGYHLTDALCGYKAYRAASLLKKPYVLDALLETEYIAAELYIRFGRNGFQVDEIPTNVLERPHGKSHKGTFRYGFAVIWVILRAWMSRNS
jgi:hypothetical protein